MVQRLREKERRRVNPREMLQQTREIEAQRQKELSFKLKEELTQSKQNLMAKLKERINSVKKPETSADKRFRRSVLNKTQYLMRLS